MLLHHSMLVHRRTSLIRRLHPYMSFVRLFGYTIPYQDYRRPLAIRRCDLYYGLSYG